MGLTTLDTSAATTSPSFADPAASSGAPVPQPGDRLLLAVAQSLRVLLGAGELRHNIAQALRLLGEAAQMHRVKVILDQPVDAGQPPFHALTYEWWAPGFESQASLGVVNFPNTAIPEYLLPLHGGQSLWQFIEDVPPSLRVSFERVGMRSMGIVPIFVKARYAGLVAFDDCVERRHWTGAEIEALTIAAHAIGAVIERERLDAARLQAEQARADQAEADSQALRQREGLLQTVTEATRALLAGSDFDAGIRAGMALLGTALDVVRVGLMQDHPRPLDDDPGGWRMTHEWTASGISPRIGVPANSHAYPAADVWQKLRDGQTVVIRIDDADADLADDPVAMRPPSILAVPLFVSGRYWGALRFDQSRNRHWADHELAVLKTAAACVGAALERERLEALRLTVERERVAESQALNHLLEGVVAASRALLEAADFQIGLQRWLAHLAQALDADRAIYGLLEPPAHPHAVASSAAFWMREGIAPTGGWVIPPSADFIAWATRLQEGDTVWAQREDLTDPLSMQFWDEIGCQTNLIVPVVVGTRSVGFMAFDWVTRHEWRPAYTSVLRTAADGLAAAIKRQEALQALMEERERSAIERTAELSQANASMRRTLARLAAAEEVDAFLATALLELHKQSGATRSFLFAPTVEEDHRLRLHGSVRHGRFQREGEPDDPPIFSRGFVPSDNVFGRLGDSASLLWRPVDPARHPMPRDGAVQRWLQQQRIGADACCLLQVGDRTIGLLVMNFTGDEPLPPSRSELLVALSQPMALALELGRLGRVAQRAAQDRAVLAERNRMARDVHDTLAQGFGAISMQLQAAARAGSADERDRFVARATQEAQANLVESRRTIRLLRGMADPGEVTHALVHVIEDALASRLSGSSLSWRVLPLPEGLSEPALDEEARRELKRIAQEAATNALKHAGASVFEAGMELRSDGGLTLRLMDHGRGFDPKVARDGFGLMGMRERAARIGATLHVESQPGGPTAVIVLLPPRSMSVGSQGAP